MQAIHLPVLAHYDMACQPTRVEYLAGAGGFSGSQFWRLQTPEGLLCLRCYAAGLVEPEQLDFIRAVLSHVQATPALHLPVAILTRDRRAYVRHGGRLWDLTRWLPGKPLERRQIERWHVSAAMEALARFHRVAESFPRPPFVAAESPPPAVAKRLTRLRELATGKAVQIVAAVEKEAAADSKWRELGAQLLSWFQLDSANRLRTLVDASSMAMPIQVCIRDVWRDNVLFDTLGQVAALLDFTELGFDSVATDIARLLGSLIEGHPEWWTIGIEAYEAVRPLTLAERQLAETFDRANLLLSGWNWLEWLFVEQRPLGNLDRIEERLRHFLARLAESKAGHPPSG